MSMVTPVSLVNLHQLPYSLGIGISVVSLESIVYSDDLPRFIPVASQLASFQYNSCKGGS